ncbi:hypothetical protein SNEBB_003227 [Seison nebaliae]|nr:hypothetical protein SNEBB_003227 [Seison nebaliae]
MDFTSIEEINRTVELVILLNSSFCVTEDEEKILLNSIINNRMTEIGKSKSESIKSIIDECEDGIKRFIRKNAAKFSQKDRSVLCILNANLLLGMPEKYFDDDVNRNNLLLKIHKILLMAIKLTGMDFDKWCSFTEFYLRQKEASSALFSIENALKICPTNSKALRLKCQCLRTLTNRYSNKIATELMKESIEVVRKNKGELDGLTLLTLANGFALQIHLYYKAIDNALESYRLALKAPHCEYVPELLMNYSSILFLQSENFTESFRQLWLSICSEPDWHMSLKLFKEIYSAFLSFSQFTNVDSTAKIIWPKTFHSIVSTRRQFQLITRRSLKFKEKIEESNYLLAFVIEVIETGIIGLSGLKVIDKNSKQFAILLTMVKQVNVKKGDLLQIFRGKWTDLKLNDDVIKVNRMNGRKNRHFLIPERIISNNTITIDTKSKGGRSCEEGKSLTKMIRERIRQIDSKLTNNHINEELNDTSQHGNNRHKNIKKSINNNNKGKKGSFIISMDFTFLVVRNDGNNLKVFKRK